MRIVTTSCTKGRSTAITIEADKEEDLTVLKGMLNSHVWVRMNKYNELESAPAHRDPPLVYDDRIDPIWDGKPAMTKKLRDFEKEDNLGKDRSIYVQSIEGYDGDRDTKAQKLTFNGFVSLRSRKGMRDGKCWEIWYLPGPWAAEGELRGKNIEYIIDWLCREIRPGTIELGGRRYGLVLD